ncbi:MAG: N-acetylneuraminate synthase family protein [Magnetovibrionaceae bacterium]
MMSNAKSFLVGDRPVGAEAPCYVIAEIGSNHNHDFDLARRLIDGAAAAKVDAVKFQTFRAKSHYSSKTPGFGYLENTNTFDLIQSLELDRSWHEPLQAHAREQGVDFFSSPCDFEAIAELKALDVPAYKVASFDLPDEGLITAMAETGKPLILSTGMADYADIQRGVGASRRAGNDQIALLQCTSLYPAPAGLSNLAAMPLMAEAFGVVPGYSDHTTGDHVVLAAVALGAKIIEKHFTLDRDLPGPDHPFAINPAELTALMVRLRDVEAALGDGQKNGPRPEEQEMYEKGRRSLHASVDIKAGTPITDDMLTIKRPGYGISPHLRDVVVGRSAKQDIEADQWLTWEMV